MKMTFPLFYLSLKLYVLDTAIFYILLDLFFVILIKIIYTEHEIFCVCIEIQCNVATYLISLVLYLKTLFELSQVYSHII